MADKPVGRKGRTWPQEVTNFVLNELPRDVDFDKLDLPALGVLLSLRFYGLVDARLFRPALNSLFAEAR